MYSDVMNYNNIKKRMDEAVRCNTEMSHAMIDALSKHGGKLKRLRSKIKKTLQTN